MKTKYLLTILEGETASKDTLTSIAQNLDIKGATAETLTSDDYTTVTYKDSLEEALNAAFEKIKSSDFTHVCIVNNGSVLKEYASNTVKTYITNDEILYMPMVELLDSSEPGSPFRGFLNSSLWKPYFATEIGVLDLQLAKKGVDLIIDGCYIPKKIISEHKLNPEIKYFSTFEFFNKIISAGEEIVGIPKVTMRVVKDYTLKSIPNDEKLKYFKMAQSSAVEVLEVDEIITDALPEAGISV